MDYPPFMSEDKMRAVVFNCKTELIAIAVAHTSHIVH